MAKKSKLEDTKTNIVNNYKASSYVAIAPLWLSYELLSHYANDRRWGTQFKILGYTTLPLTLALTAVTAAVGIIGAVSNTVWAAGAIPYAAVQDFKKENEQQVPIELAFAPSNQVSLLDPGHPSSTKKMHCAFEMPQIASLNEQKGMHSSSYVLFEDNKVADLVRTPRQGIEENKTPLLAPSF